MAVGPALILDHRPTYPLCPSATRALGREPLAGTSRPSTTPRRPGRRPAKVAGKAGCFAGIPAQFVQRTVGSNYLESCPSRQLTSRLGGAASRDRESHPPGTRPRRQQRLWKLGGPGLSLSSFPFCKYLPESPQHHQSSDRTGVSEPQGQRPGWALGPCPGWARPPGPPRPSGFRLLPSGCLLSEPEARERGTHTCTPLEATPGASVLDEAGNANLRQSPSTRMPP